MAHILLVEDSPEVSMTVREILATAGHTIEEAPSGNAPLTYTAPLAATFGANLVIYKPFEKGELLKAVDTVLSD